MFTEAVMEGMSIWIWVPVVALIGVAVVAVATERSGQRMPRAAFFGLTVAAWIVGGLLERLAEHAAVHWAPGVALTVTIVSLLLMAVVGWFYFRIAARRSRDAIGSRALAFAMAVPVIGLLAMLTLFFWPSQAEDPPDPHGVFV
ncbi:MAG: hypothetical protein TEF_01875 [Rhizobiales bacterium NRL2]|nr:MAG: hypothetical protein TEF_01875 [Rhizobiales bacterium NRL2]